MLPGDYCGWEGRLKGILATLNAWPVTSLFYGVIPPSSQWLKVHPTI